MNKKIGIVQWLAAIFGVDAGIILGVDVGGNNWYRNYPITWKYNRNVYTYPGVSVAIGAVTWRHLIRIIRYRWQYDKADA